jgi:membrane protein
VAPGAAGDLLSGALEGIRSSQGASGVLLLVSIAAALWSASGYIGAFMDAANSIWDVEEGRPVWKTVPLRLAVTVVILALLVLSAIGVVFTGSLAETAGQALGLDNVAVTVWSIAKWPVIVILVSLMFSILYYATPNVRQPGFPWVTPGGVLAVVLWIAASALFAFYVANFSSYNETYGSLGGVIIFLVWLWISNIAILVGAELNAELERGRQIAAGMRPPDREPFLEPRDEPDR